MAKTTTALLDKEGNIISKFEWQARREDATYWLLHRFESTRGHIVTAEFSGKILNAHRIPKSKWEPWALEVHVKSKYDADGRELDEPLIERERLGCETFKTFEELVQAYNKFLIKYCDVTTPFGFSKGKEDPVREPEPVYESDEETDDEGDSSEKSWLEDASKEPPSASIPVADPESDKVSGDVGGD